MSDREGLFGGDDPFEIARKWLAEATETEINDPNAIALATVDASGMPNSRMVLLKEIEDAAFVFYTNYESAKAQEIEASGTASFVMHWKSLRRQIRVRGHVTKENGPQADEYFASRSLKSRLGAWASKQSQPLASRSALMAEVAKITAQKGPNPKRPEFWGGYRITPIEIEFWADGAFRLHDRFVWRKNTSHDNWTITRLSP
ncbi:pyridoxamine 5'-phosphate oxidase [Ruegeria sp. TM1040]|jgi:pyridoxamine 5'-phosphate oxidase|uniref:Pyridoxine/pyridoxamine 5'-phosphate oxidase n=1 Tax=Ruegeria sp. (strain TM1040) TaxID=292414 RepID=PDXH_RUEST|nr:pyridoxamine 5'-phosphate oxidase [Ruegeria sp. TM1040]Q1GHI5.1 RecName: Full=Pyridoxine/pyridoxamine 5'-phosphate oxidase; AltName: Full=PNP/PMP oxidase; Short=PNPOx; AltName: Full=Pyridoxal 5'-phosphate synthase [Ruegeria sp. TM1040]ABF63881.1 Pyridoxamine 5'-phosphate oxidase [Ruegeria sp. TM1040]MDF9302655.1 pyridoxamine 5'-phosphate oxidase [Tritonibacter mobilis]